MINPVRIYQEHQQQEEKPSTIEIVSQVMKITILSLLSLVIIGNKDDN
jgi:hypothetical protein